MTIHKVEISIAIRELSSPSPPIHRASLPCFDTMREGKKGESERGREAECVNENE